MLRPAFVIAYLIFALTTGAVAMEASSWIPLTGSSHPKPAEIEVVEQNNDSVLLDMKLDGIYIRERQERDEKFHLLSIPGSYWTNETGKPRLPVARTFLAIPSYDKVNIQVEDEDYTILKEYKPYPVGKEVVRGSYGEAVYVDEEFAIDREFYSTDSFYPQNLASISFSGKLRDETIIQLELHPIRYNPGSQELMCYSFLRVRLSYEGKAGGQVAISGGLGPLANVCGSSIANYTAMALSSSAINPAQDGNVIYPDDLLSRQNADYLIIAPEPFYSSENLKKLAEWRAQYNGFDVAVVSTEKLYYSFGGRSTNPDERIRMFIQYVYNSWKAEHTGDSHLGYVLLIGDVEFLPIHVSEEKSFDETITTDNWYACVSGDDLMPDIMLGRLPAKSVTELDLMIDKIVQYERDPLNGDWANSALLLLGTVESIYEDMEDARDEYLLPAGYNVNVVGSLNGGNASSVVTELNKGQQIVDYAGHGWVNGWEIFQKTDIPRLKNDRKLPAIFSLACSTGYFDHPDTDSLAESFLKTRNGAIAFFGSTRLASISNVGFGLSEAIARSHIYTLGEIVMHTKLKLLPDSTNMDLYNLLGDPALDLCAARRQPDMSDLVISPVDISFEPEKPKQGEEIQISVTVNNFGIADAYDVTVELRDNSLGGKIIDTHKVTRVPAGGKTELQTPWRTPLGQSQHQIYVKAYIADDAKEYYKENNDAQKLLLVSLESEGWPIEVAERLLSAPIAADVDSDGDMELLIQSNIYTDNKIYIWHHDGQPVAGWPKLVRRTQYDYKNQYSNPSAGPAPAVGDLDGDSNPEIVTAFFTREIYAWKNDGSNLPGWPIKTSGYATTSPVLADLDEDGKMEVIFGLANGELDVRRYDGSNFPGWPVSFGQQGHVFPMVADVNDDNRLEVVAVHSPLPKGAGINTSTIQVWQSNASTLNGWPVQMQGADTILPPSAGDLDGDGKSEIVAASVSEEVCKVYVWNHDGSIKPGWPLTTDCEIRSAFALGDLEQNGDIEIIACSDENLIYAWQYNGKKVFGWPVNLGEHSWNSAPILCDVDGNNDTDIVFTSYGGVIHAYRQDGTSIQGWPAITEESFSSSPPVAADMDGDGNIELAYASGSGRIHLLSLTGLYNAQAGSEWNMFLHDQMHTGSYNINTILPLPPSNLTASDLPDDKGGKIILSWQLSPDDDRATGYIIYRSNAINGRYSILAKVQPGVSSYIDDEAKSGVTYWYMVRTSYAAYLSIGSNIVNTYSFNNFAPMPPNSVYAKSGNIDRIIDIWWLMGKEPDIAGYKVYYGTSPGVYDETVNVGITGHHILTGIANGTLYYISVTAYDKEGNESIYSNEANAAPADEDTTQPSFSSFYPKEAAEGLAFYIKCGISDPSGIYDDPSGKNGQGVYLIWDDDGEILEDFHTLQMSAISQDLYVTDGKIPAHLVGEKILYQVYAYDDDYDWGNPADRSLGKSQEQTINIVPAPSQVYSYPNPAGRDNGKVNFQYYVSSDADVIIRIYDISGHLVEIFENQAQGGRYNHTEWDISGIASGVYVYIVEIQPVSGEKKSIRKKLAIIN